MIFILPLPTARRAISRRRQELLEFRASSSNATWARFAAWLSAGGSRTQSGGKCRGGGDGIAKKEGKETLTKGWKLLFLRAIQFHTSHRIIMLKNDTCRQRKIGPGQCVCLFVFSIQPSRVQTKPRFSWLPNTQTSATLQNIQILTTQKIYKISLSWRGYGWEETKTKNSN